MKQAVKNSVWQGMNSLAAVAINFLLVLAYTRVLHPETFGSLVLSQAQVLFWALLVDLGLYNGLIAALTSAGADREHGAHYDRPLLKRVLAFRLGGATAATLILLGVAWFAPTASPSGNSVLQDIAFTPFLFGLALQQTLTPYAIFRGRLILCLLANIGGILAAAIMALGFALSGGGIAGVLLLQSLSGIFATVIVFIGMRGKPFFGASAGKAPEGISRLLWNHSWPFAIIFAAATLWGRFDQIIASRMLGLVEGGEYAIAVRFAAIPATLAAAVATALFPDLQRVGRDDPAKLLSYTGRICRALLFFGLPFSYLACVALAFFAKLFFPAYASTPALLPWFAPGIWALWLNIFLVGALSGLGRFREAALAHFLAVALYVVALPILAAQLGAKGVAVGYDLYCVSLSILTLVFLARVQKKL